MRLTRIAAATLVAGSLTLAGSGVALADTVTPVTASSIVSGSTASAVSEPGTLMLSASSVRPGASITFSGTVATPTTGTGPITVTSPAFAGPAVMDRTDPTAFSGSATVAAGMKPGSYPVTASSAAGTVSSKLTVLGTGPAPVPPAPIHHGGTGTGTHTTGHSTSSGTENPSSTQTSGTDVTEIDAAGIDTVAAESTGSDVLPWVLGGAGAIVLIGGGAYAIGRRRATDRTAASMRDDDRRYDEPRTEVMNRR